MSCVREVRTDAAIPMNFRSSCISRLLQPFIVNPAGNLRLLVPATILQDSTRHPTMMKISYKLSPSPQTYRKLLFFNPGKKVTCTAVVVFVCSPGR